MKPISTDLENIFQPVQLREDEYLKHSSFATIAVQIKRRIAYGN